MARFLVLIAILILVVPRLAVAGFEWHCPEAGSVGVIGIIKGDPAYNGWDYIKISNPDFEQVRDLITAGWTIEQVAAFHETDNGKAVAAARKFLLDSNRVPQTDVGILCTRLVGLRGSSKRWVEVIFSKRG